jgi:hypothetical protein
VSENTRTLISDNAAAWRDGTLSMPCAKCKEKDAEVAALKAKAKVADEYYTGEATRSMAEEIVKLREALEEKP